MASEEPEPVTENESFSLPRLLASTLLLLAIAAGAWVYLFGLPGLSAEAESSASTAADTGSSSSDAPRAGQSGGSDSGVSAPTAVPVPVRTALATRADLVKKITATGTAEAERQVTITAPLGGLIEKVAVAEGDRVQEGDRLVEFETQELELDVQRAREQLVQAMAKYSEKQIFLSRPQVESEVRVQMQEAEERLLSGVISREAFRNLIEDPRFDALFETITREEVMAAQDGLQQARAAYTTAELALERARVLAPFGGQVAPNPAGGEQRGTRPVVEGQRVSAGTELLTLVDADPIRVRVDVLESDSGLVRVGREARVRFAAYPTEVFTGRVETISPMVDSETKTLEVIVILPNPGLRLKPGMYARIALDTEIFDDRLLVPESAVLLRDERPMLFVVRDDRAEWIYITEGLKNEEFVEVLEGVEAGDEVIVSGHYSLAHDAVVRVIEEEEGGPEDTGEQR